MGIIGTLFCLIKFSKVCPRFLLVMLVVSDPADFLAVLVDDIGDIPIFPVCHSLAKGQYCLCCTIFLKVRFILYPQAPGLRRSA